jgi:hypothetical protein
LIVLAYLTWTVLLRHGRLAEFPGMHCLIDIVEL